MSVEGCASAQHCIVELNIKASCCKPVLVTLLTSQRHAAPANCFLSLTPMVHASDTRMSQNMKSCQSVCTSMRLQQFDAGAVVLWQAGAITGFIAAFVEGPIDFYKSQIQVQIIRSRADPNYKRSYAGSHAFCTLTFLHTCCIMPE